METNLPNSPDFTPYVYRTQNICDNTLDDAHLESRCPLDNGRHDCTPISMRFDAGLLDKLPLELLVDVLLQLDIPSLTRLRCLNRRSVELVNSVRQYAAISKHCPDIIRAILSIQADAFDCATLYGTLCTSQCSTCHRFGDHLYLIDCRRVCYLCYTRRPEYFPLTSHEASKFFTTNAISSDSTKTPRKLLVSAKIPNILSLPGRYCAAWTTRGGNLQRKRIRLYDRLAVVQSLSGPGLPQLDKTTREPKRFMAIITAPMLLNAGRQADQGFFCLGCRDESTEGSAKHFRNKYTTQSLSEHIASCGSIEEMSRIPGRFMHVAKDQIKL